jgi:hypothetical protein
MRTIMYFIQRFEIANAKIQIQITQYAMRVGMLLSLFIGFAIGQTGVNARNPLVPIGIEQAQYAGFTFEGNTYLATPIQGDGMVVAVPYFAGLEGFGSARMSAHLSAGGGQLYVVISNVSISELPVGVTLGIVTIEDGEVVRNFVVRTDGGGTIVVDEDY